MRIRALGWAACGLLAVLCCSGVIAGPADGADSVLAADAGLHMDAFLGTFAWAANGGGLSWGLGGGPYRLVLFSQGQARLAPITPFDSDFEPPVAGLGADRNGAPVAAYSRCAPNIGCDLFALNLRSGSEHKLRATSSRRWAEDEVAVSGGRYLFRRPCYSSRRSQCQGTGLFVSSPLRRITPSSVGSLDLRGRVVAFTEFRHAAAVAGFNTVVVGHLSSRNRARECVLADSRQVHATGLRRANVMWSPAIGKRFIYWIAGPDPTNEQSGLAYVLRRRTPTIDCKQRGPIERLRRTEGAGAGFDRVAVTGGRVFYTAWTGTAMGLKLSLFEMSATELRH